MACISRGSHGGPAAEAQSLLLQILCPEINEELADRDLAINGRVHHINAATLPTPSPSLPSALRWHRPLSSCPRRV